MRQAKMIRKLDQHSLRPDRQEADVPPVRPYSVEREPWRVLRSSMAVQFALRKRSRRSRSDLNNEIQSGLEARRSIRLAYTDVRAALFDLTLLFRRAVASTGTAPNELELTRQLAAAGEPLSRWRDSLIPIVEELELNAPLTQGFAYVTERRSGRVHFRFEFGRARKNLSCEDLKAREVQFWRFAKEAIDLIADVSHETVRATRTMFDDASHRNVGK